jgi:hypothetical protein
MIAVDWSGRGKPDHRHYIWLCEISGSEVQRLESGRLRPAVVEHLVELAGSDSSLVVGLDFAFSAPAWYLAERGLHSPRKLWSLLAEEALTERMGEIGLRRWLNEPEWPFWRTSRPADLTSERRFRRTEAELASRGIRPTSIFQLVGPSQVGPGSLYGWQALDELRRRGFSIWPFDRPRFPLVVEIYPRVLTGPVVKSDRAARETYLEKLDLRPSDRADARSDDNAFDALISALAMAEAAETFSGLLGEDPLDALEGRIWEPPTVSGAPVPPLVS